MFPLNRSTVVVKMSIFVTILGVSHRKITDLTAYFTIKLFALHQSFCEKDLLLSICSA